MIRISTTTPSGTRSNAVNTVPTITVFKGGEVNVQLSTLTIEDIKNPKSKICLTMHFNNSNDFFALALVVDAIRRVSPGKQIYANIPYFPYARQDRVCNTGEALSVAVMAKLVNTLELTEVAITDPHSDVTPALINNCKVITQLQVFQEHVLPFVEPRNFTLVAPDQGAYKKTLEIAKVCGFAGMVHANKTRNPATMEITGLELCGDVAGKNVLVVDDIIDGGRTFIELGNKLKEAGAQGMFLFATHGIFSYGVEKLAEMYTEVHTTNSFHHFQTLPQSHIHPRVIFHDL